MSRADTPTRIQISARDVLPDRELFARIARGGAGLAVELRDPDLATSALLELGRELRARTRAVGARLIVNDRLDVAHALEADGVHLGRRSVGVEDARRLLGAHIWISRSAHSLEEAVAAAQEGADAVLLSPIFPSPGKGTPLGPAALGAARAAIGDCGLVALGGVTRASLAECRRAGADGVAFVRADLVAVAG